MLSYRHGFHAGNHGDVLKHIVLVQLMRYLGQKDKPLWFVDTHAGAAAYALDEGFATKKQEYESGISRLWGLRAPPQAIAEYLAEVRALNPDGALRRYPGSPQLALRVLRTQDRLRLFELHSTESRLLRQYFHGQHPRVMVQAGDGFAGLRAVLPPPSRRALVLIDPSYEDKGDYRQTLAAARDALQRFREGVYAIWYPQVQRRESRELPAKLRQLQARDWLHVSLTVKKPQADGFGLHGSGVFVFNPPWVLPDALRAAMPTLATALAQDATAGFSLECELA